MGAVYEGVHELINRRVAIKALHPQLAPNPEFVSRFLTEARATNRVDHPGLVQILDFHESPRGEVYIIMEYLDEKFPEPALMPSDPVGRAQVRSLAQAQWAILLAALVPALQQLIDEDKAQGRPPTQRARIGMFSFHEPLTEMPDENQPDPEPDSERRT